MLSSRFLRSSYLLLLFSLASLFAHAQHRPEVILSTDCGTEIDDQWAIADLLTSPLFNFTAIVGTHAPNLASAETSANCARDVIRRVHPAHPPRVFAGSSVPLHSETEALKNVGVDFIVERARQHSSSDRLLLLTIGAATDAASVLLVDPSLSNRIAIVAMGFNRWPEGGKEWNVNNDPLAYRVILRSRVPLTVGCGDICRRYLTLTGTQVDQMMAGRGPVGQWLASLFHDWIRRNPKLDTGPDSWVIWDVITVADILGHAKATPEPRPDLNPSTEIFTHGNEGTIQWITEVDSQWVWSDFLKKLSTLAGSQSEAGSPSHLTKVKFPNR